MSNAGAMIGGASAAHGGAGAAPKSIPSLHDDGVKLVGRLVEVLSRVRAINERLHGPQPRDAGTAAAIAPEPQPSVRRHLDAMRSIVADIEQEVQSIDARL